MSQGLHLKVDLPFAHALVFAETTDFPVVGHCLERGITGKNVGSTA